MFQRFFSKIADLQELMRTNSREGFQYMYAQLASSSGFREPAWGTVERSSRGPLNTSGSWHRAPQKSTGRIDGVKLSGIEQK